VEKSRSKSFKNICKEPLWLYSERICKTIRNKHCSYLSCIEKVKDYPKKKTYFYRERDEVKRALFLEQIKPYEKNLLVYIDESGIDSYFHRSYGWGISRERIYGSISGKRFARESFIAAKCGSKILAPLCFQGTCNLLLFNKWVEEFLVPELKAGQIVILDNASFHKSQTAKEMIEQAGCKMLFLPPYSPDLNPIEKFWSWFKSKVRSIIHNFKSLSEAIDYVFKM